MSSVNKASSVILFLCVLERWEQFVDASELLFAGYLLHYVPYLTADRTMFIYSYIPALCFQILLIAFLIEHIHALIW